MPRTSRKTSSSDYYHVIVKGVGSSILFEDDTDRLRFLSVTRQFSTESNASIVAWCLMSNHVHMLVCAKTDNLSTFMHKLCTSYALYFNARHGRTGTLFQDRFQSEPVETDEYLLSVIRYIHQNPVRKMIAPIDQYRWSSFCEYAGKPDMCETERALDLFGGREAFLKFHSIVPSECDFMTPYRRNKTLSDEAALKTVRSKLGETALESLPTCNKSNRDELLREMKALGLPIRQIARLTGIGRSIVERA